MTETDPAVAQIQLGLLLLRLREATGMSAEVAGAHVGTSKASISRVENGKQSMDPEKVSALLDFYGANDGDQAEAMKLATVPRPQSRKRSSANYRDQVPNWFRRFLGLESQASEIFIYENEIVTGLFQTEDYARVLLEAGNPLAPRKEIDREVELRNSRQAILDRPNPPLLDVIMHETVLHRVIGNDEIMAAQLDKLLKLSNSPNIQLRIFPFRPRPTPTRDEALTARNVFTLLRLPDRGTLLYLEEVGGATYPEDIEVIQQYAATYQRLRAAAEAPEGSRHLIAKVAKQYR
ncbi:MAG TPA: helix-turn-helix transcriptional regulator [Pseudonocardiaceae bacterium]